VFRAVSSAVTARDDVTPLGLIFSITCSTLAGRRVGVGRFRFRPAAPSSRLSSQRPSFLATLLTGVRHPNLSRGGRDAI
jgi:hypothetical protein